MVEDGLARGHGVSRNLRAIILAATGQDVRLCNACSNCEGRLRPGMDLTPGEIFQAAARNDRSVLACRSLWDCDEIIERPPQCQAGLDIAAILLALQAEARDHPFTQEGA
jgi:heterodisulfide reductase subunit C